MKKLVRKIAIMLFMMNMISMVFPSITGAQPGVSVSFNVFYDNLSPYGSWVQDPGYGYVWVPDAGPDFRPYYSGGHWVMTEYGNTWVSDYNWGWAPFHYGRWTYDGYYGWVWVPDYEWGPSWVSWRWGGSYCGWAPLRPGIRIDVGFNNYNPPNDWWVFIPPAYIHHPHFYQYYRGPNNNVTIIHNTNIITNVYVNNNIKYVSGPRKNDIENVTHKSVSVYQVRNETKPGKTIINNNVVNVYRPEVRKDASAKPTKNVIKEDHRLGEAQPVSVNGGKPQRLNTVKQNSSNTTPKRVEPGKTPAPQTKQERTNAPDKKIAPPIRKEAPNRMKKEPETRDRNPGNNEPEQKQILQQPKRDEEQRQAPNPNTPDLRQPPKDEPKNQPVPDQPDKSPDQKAVPQTPPDIQQQTPQRQEPPQAQPRQSRREQRIERRRSQRDPH